MSFNNNLGYAICRSALILSSTGGCVLKRFEKVDTADFVLPLNGLTI